MMLRTGIRLCCAPPAGVHVVSPTLGLSPLSSLFLSYILQVEPRGLHRSSLKRLICPAQYHFIFLTLLLIQDYDICSIPDKKWLNQTLVILSLYAMVCAAASSFCACLVSVQVSVP